MSRSKKMALALFAGLDTVSELSEIIDAFYDALPKDVRKRWDQEGRGLIDQAGQYGIDGVDYKMQALFWNFHRVDPGQALHNIMKNALEDQLVGAVAKNLPVNVGRVNQTPQQISDLLDWLFGKEAPAPMRGWGQQGKDGP